MNKVQMRSRDKETRVNNFSEVNLGYNKEEAQKEANRCLNCQNPRCVKGCPIGIKIPKFIEAIKNDDINLAYEIIREDNLFPGICGRVCPQEKQCESMCIKGFKGDAISIGSLERYVSDEAIKINNKKKSNGKTVAIVGSGPSGLACASILQSEGFSVTIYESLHKAGGVLTYGIPEFRLPKKIVDKEIEALVDLGVKFVFNAPIGLSLSITELKSKYDAVYLATGAGLPRFMGIKNECANGVFSANEVLTRINLMGAYNRESKTPVYEAKRVVVVGCGNVAIDAARSLRRMGASVSIVYRRSELEAPARKEEIKHAKEEGIEFLYLTNPKEIIVENNEVVGMEVSLMELIDDGTERRSVKEIQNAIKKIDCDMVVMALGTMPNSLILNDSNIKTDTYGLILVDDTKTNIDRVYAGGDAVTGAATVILAYEAGKKAALKIIDDISI